MMTFIDSLRDKTRPNQKELINSFFEENKYKIYEIVEKYKLLRYNNTLLNTIERLKAVTNNEMDYFDQAVLDCKYDLILLSGL